VTELTTVTDVSSIFT